MTGRTSPITREILRSMQRFQGSTVFVAPSRMGPFERDEFGMFLEDAELLARIGIRVFLADYEGDAFWPDEELPKVLHRIRVGGNEELLKEACSCSAITLCLASGADRIITSKGHQLDDVPLEEAHRLLNENVMVTVESRETLDLAVRACEAGIQRVHVFNIHRDGALLEELFTDFGAGTMIYAGKHHKMVRRIEPQDRLGVCTLLREIIPRRTAEFVREQEYELWVFVVDGEVHGTARFSSRDDMLVVRNLMCSSRVTASEGLSTLLRTAITEARESRISKVLIPVDEIPALMRILPWFTDLGFGKGRTHLGGGLQDVWIKDVN